MLEHNGCFLHQVALLSSRQSFIFLLLDFFSPLKYLSCDVAAEYLKLTISCSKAVLANQGMFRGHMHCDAPLCHKRRGPEGGHSAATIKCRCLPTTGLIVSLFITPEGRQLAHYY